MAGVREQSFSHFTCKYFLCLVESRRNTSPRERERAKKSAKAAHNQHRAPGSLNRNKIKLMNSDETSDLQLRYAQRRLERLTVKIGLVVPGAQDATNEAMKHIDPTAPAFKQAAVRMALDLKRYRELMLEAKDLKDRNQPQSRISPKLSEMRRLEMKIKGHFKTMSELRGTERDREDYDMCWSKWEKTLVAAKAVTRFDAGAPDILDGEYVPPPVVSSASGGGGAQTPLMADVSTLTAGGSTDYRDEEFEQFYMQVQQRNVEIDQVVDRLAVGVTKLQDTAVKIGGELRVQDTILKEAEKKTERLTAKVNTLNGKVKEAIKQVGRDQMCLYMFCCLLLLGIVGFILYETHVVK